MTKIREIARISPIKKVTAVPTPPKKLNGANNPGFRAFLELRHSEATTLQDLTAAAVYEHEQPMTIVEIVAYLNKELGTSYSEQRIRYGLDALVKDGKLITRNETQEERKLRANGATPSSKLAVLYYRPNSKGVPARTKVEVVPGVILKGVDSPRAPYKKSPRASKEVRTAPAVMTGLDQSALDFLIEKIVHERTAELRRQLDEANQKLARFRKLMDE